MHTFIHTNEQHRLHFILSRLESLGVISMLHWVLNTCLWYAHPHANHHRFDLSRRKASYWSRKSTMIREEVKNRNHSNISVRVSRSVSALDFSRGEHVRIPKENFHWFFSVYFLVEREKANQWWIFDVKAKMNTRTHSHLNKRLNEHKKKSVEGAFSVFHLS